MLKVLFKPLKCMLRLLIAFYMFFKCPKQRRLAQCFFQLFTYFYMFFFFPALDWLKSWFKLDQGKLDQGKLDQGNKKKMPKVVDTQNLTASQEMMPPPGMQNSSRCVVV